MVILTPCRASKEKDVTTRVELLKGLRDFDHVERYYHLSGDYGLEIVGPLDDFVIASRVEDIFKNLERAKREVHLERLVIHAPVTRDNYRSAPTNLSRSESVEVLNEVFEVARKIGASLVNVHSETFMTKAEMEELTDADRKRLLGQVAENLSRVKKGEVKLAIENMPVPLMGDMYFSSRDMIYDPLFADPLEIAEFAENNGYYMTFDTCHWGTLGVSGSLVDIFKKIQHSVQHIHLSDVWGVWREGTCCFREGLIPGRGNIGRDSFIELLRYVFTDLPREISVTAEVADGDFVNPEESRSALIAIQSWMYPAEIYAEKK